MGRFAMPTYEYRCPRGHTFELFQRMSDPVPEACEVCEASPVERVLYPVAVHFKGSGFYATDYGRGGSKPEPSKDGDRSSGKEKKDEKASSGASSATSGPSSSSTSSASNS